MSGVALQRHYRSSRRSPDSARTSPPRWFIVTAALESVGDGIARSLLPIVAVTILGAGPAFIGILNAVSLAGFLLLSLPLGALADRWSAPVRMMSASSLARAVAVLAGLSSWALGLLEGVLGLVLLLAMALIIGIADVVFTSGRQILLPRLVPVDQIRPLVGKVQSASQASTLAAPVVLTVLLSLFAAPVAWIGAAVSYLASIFAQSALRSADTRERPDVPIRTLHAQMREGFSLISSVPQLKMITAANMLMNSSSMVANTLLPVIALSTLRIPAAHFAALGSLGAVAGIAGAATASGVTSKIGLRWTRVGTSVCASIGIVIILLLVARPGFLPGPPLGWVGAQYALTFFSTALALVAGSDLIARLVPRESLGVAAGAQRTLVMGAMPVAALAVGGLASMTTMPIAIGVWLALASLSLLPTSFLKELP
jgi:hypothetical protein